jgi:hypothetical protein
MPVSSGDIIRGVWGAWRLAKRDTGGMAMFDISPDGAAKSFVAAVLAFPAYMAMEAFQLGNDWALLFQAVPLAISILGFVAIWLLMPAALTWILPWLDRGRRLPETIVALNWAALLMTFAQLVLVALAAAGLFPGPLAIVAGVVVAVGCYLYEGFVLRTAAEIDVSYAAGLVVFDAVTGYLLDSWITVVLQSAL